MKTNKLNIAVAAGALALTACAEMYSEQGDCQNPPTGVQRTLETGLDEFGGGAYRFVEAEDGTIFFDDPNYNVTSGKHTMDDRLEQCASYNGNEGRTSLVCASAPIETDAEDIRLGVITSIQATFDDDYSFNVVMRRSDQQDPVIEINSTDGTTDCTIERDGEPTGNFCASACHQIATETFYNLNRSYSGFYVYD